jgi:hypothetical protein
MKTLGRLPHALRERQESREVSVAEIVSMPGVEKLVLYLGE